MSYYKIDKNTIWEDTGRVVVYNFPPDKYGFAYLKRIYKQTKKGEFGWKEVEGPPIYINDLPPAERALAICFANASNGLSVCLPIDNKLKKAEVTSEQYNTAFD